MNKTAWWKIAVIVVLGIAVMGVMQLKAKQAATDRARQDAVATVPGVDEEAVAPTPEPMADPVATPSTESSTTTVPAVTSNTAKAPPASKTAAGGTGKTTTTPTGTAAPAPPSTPAPVKAVPVKKATFVELGADKCVPCKMMQPIMDELRQEYPDTLKVVFYDVWKDPAMADKYGIQSIPTQVLLDGDGKEIFRHVGFWPKDEIVAKYKELGINL